MKTITLTLFLLLSAPVFSQTSYQLRFKSNTGQAANHLIITTDNNSIVSSGKSDSARLYSQFITKFNEDGVLQWSKDFGINGKIVQMISLIPVTDNGFIGGLKSSDSGIINSIIIIFKADSTGKIIWQKNILPTAEINYDRQSSITLSAADDGGVFCLLNFVVHKFDIYGNLLWSSTTKIKPETDYSTRITDMAGTRDGGFVLCVSIESCESYCERIYFLKFNRNGKTEWRYDLNEYFTSYYDPIQLLTSDGNNNISFILKASINSSSTNYIYASLNEHTLKAKTYTLNGSVYSLQNFLRKKSIDIIKAKNFDYLPSYYRNEFLVSKPYVFGYDWSLLDASYIRTKNGTANIFVEKFDRFGRLCPDYTLPVIQDSATVGEWLFSKSIFHLSTPIPIIVEDGNDLTAITYKEPLEEICLGKAPEIAEVTSKDFLVTKVISSGLRISPNPAQFTLAIEGLHTNNTSHISVIDLQGKILQQATVKAATHQINISTLSKGIYILKVQDKDGMSTQKFIKE